jgi:hypothetical protein
MLREAYIPVITGILIKALRPSGSIWDASRLHVEVDFDHAALRGAG